MAMRPLLVAVLALLVACTATTAAANADQLEDAADASISQALQALSTALGPAQEEPVPRAVTAPSPSHLQSYASDPQSESLLEVADEGRAPFEDLPSMSPYDNLDGDSWAPLADPHPFLGDNQVLRSTLNTEQSLPVPAASVPVAPGLRGKPLSLAFDPLFSSLPPLTGTIGGVHPGAHHAGLTFPSYAAQPPNLPGLQAFSPVSLAPPPLPPTMPTGTKYDDKTFDTSTMISNLREFGMPQGMAPMTGIYNDRSPTFASPLDMASMEPNPMYSHPDLFGPPSKFHAYAAKRKQLMSLRTRAMAQLEARKKEIDTLQQYVEGGEAWVTRMEDQLNAWLEEERKRGGKSIQQEKSRVREFQRQLEKLKAQQRSTAAELNTYNTEMRRAAYAYKIAQHADRLKQAEHREKLLKQELTSSSTQKSAIQKEMDMTKKLMKEAMGLAEKPAAPAAPAAPGAAAPAAPGAAPAPAPADPNAAAPAPAAAPADPNAAAAAPPADAAQAGQQAPA